MKIIRLPVLALAIVFLAATASGELLETFDYVIEAEYWTEFGAYVAFLTTEADDWYMSKAKVLWGDVWLEDEDLVAIFDTSHSPETEFDDVVQYLTNGVDDWLCIGLGNSALAPLPLDWVSCGSESFEWERTLIDLKGEVVVRIVMRVESFAFRGMVGIPGNYILTADVKVFFHGPEVPVVSRSWAGTKELWRN